MLYILILLYFLAGFGISAHFEVVKNRAERLGLSLLLGMGLHTFVVYIWEMLHIALTWTSVLLGMCLFTALANVAFAKTLAAYKQFFTAKWDFRLYEFPFWGMIGYMVYASIYRAIYLPVTPYDALVGMDLLAKYAVKEGHLVSSVFTTPNLADHVQNQLFYAPFSTFSQILTRLSGNEVGQPWLAVVFVGFLLFMYGKMRSYTHPALAGLFTLLLCMISEYFGYTFMMLTDFSCSVFFGAGIAYFYDYYNDKSLKTFVLSAVLIGLSVWARSDTALFVALGVVLVFAMHIRQNPKDAIIKTALFGGIPFIFFALWNVVMVNYIFPKQPVGDQIANTATDIGNLFAIYSDMITKLMPHEILWGYVFILFLLLGSLNLLIFRDAKGWQILVWIGIVFIGLGLIDNIFEAATLENTVKRGLFKLIPLIYLYLSVNSLSAWVNEKLSKWESGT